MRVSIKVTGAQGQGVNSIGELCAKGLKRAGYCVFGYREYMSVIKGGHSSFQLDISNEEIQSSEEQVSILVCLNHNGLKKDIGSVKGGGIILHQTPQWKFDDADQKLLDDRKVTVMYLPSEKILKELNARPILGNILTTSVVWLLLDQGIDRLKKMVEEQFGHKGESVLELNFKCIEAGSNFLQENQKPETRNQKPALSEPNVDFKDHLLVTGNQAMALGMIHAGCRFFAGYPMTPSSPILTYLAEKQNETGMIIKQAEDEITAAQMMVGAMHMGTRAATATSGGGFDLMTETVSLCGISETPGVFILAQRPGPATGLPTWTAQGDLLLAVGSAHGEFPRLVMSVSDAGDAFDLMVEAFNYAEEFQIPVIVLSDKQMGEALYTQEPYDRKKAEMRRGKLVTDKDELAALKSTDRYDTSVQDGVSQRWLPGAEAATYCAESYEHDSEGKMLEGGEEARLQYEKRLRKVNKIREAIPEPECFFVKNSNGSTGLTRTIEYRISKQDEVDVLIVSWGSNKGVILDALKEHPFAGAIGYLHYSYLWPLKTEKFVELAGKAKKKVLVECNAQGQLGMLLKQETGIDFDQKILKYDGKPFFINELTKAL